MKVAPYQRENGEQPYYIWLASLNQLARTKVMAALQKVEAGNLSALKMFSGIGEIKIDWGPGYRVYFAKEGERLILLFGGGTKASQQRDILRALQLFQEYRERKKGGPR